MRQNKIYNFFLDVKTDDVYQSELTISDSLAADIVSRRASKLLHFCLDRESDILYIINSQSFDGKLIKEKFSIIKEKILEIHGVNVSSIVLGSPFSTLRVRTVESYNSICVALGDKFSEIKSIKVIEVNLDRMPITKKSIGEMGGFFNYFKDEKISFYDSFNSSGKKRVEPLLVMEAQGPFILIDISEKNKISHVLKEWAILSSCKEHLFHIDSKAVEKFSSFSDLFSISHHLDVGYPMQEMSQLLINETDMDKSSLKRAISLLQEAKEKSNAKKEEYFYFIRDGNFNEIKDVGFVELYNNDHIAKFHLDIYVDSRKLMKLFNLKEEPLILFENKNENCWDVKSSHSSWRNLKAYCLNNNLSILGLNVRSNDKSRKVGMCDYEFCHFRKISDYPDALRFIKENCKKDGFPFLDLPVIVGPIERYMGRGIQGGFIGESDGKEITIGEIKIKPPLIAINSVSHPHYADHTSTLIHEYQHMIFSYLNSWYKHKYNTKEFQSIKNSDPVKYWREYLFDMDEQQAHKRQILYDLYSGKSADELVRDKIGGIINKENYEIALMYKKLIDECKQKEKTND